PEPYTLFLLGLGAVMVGKEMLKGPALFSLDFSTSQTR
ncbi:MAG: PEP-CTERM sorting domain-containing protein, partial [Planctomycetota bacterium]